MFVQPIVDLWTGRPTAYVLTDEYGGLIQPSSPRELYINIAAAFQRDFTPLVVCRPSVMKSAWEAFVKRMPEPLWFYEDGEVFSESGEVMMTDGDEPQSRWQRNIEHADSLTAAIEAGVHYGSGAALMAVERLEWTDSGLFRIEWGG